MTANRWIITKDLIPTAGVPSRVGFGTYKGSAPETELPVEFKLYDDDGELYYEGRMETLDCDGDTAFAPLDWAMNDSGCTEMKVRAPGAAGFETL